MEQRDQKIAEECKKFGMCYMCRNHNTIECQCRVDGTFVKYPKKNCGWADYPWGNPAKK